MAVAVKLQHFKGGTAVATPDRDSVELATIIRGLVSDIADLTAKLAVVTAKLDLDAGVTDTNYGALSAAATRNVTNA